MSDTIQIRVVDKSDPSSYANPEGWRLSDTEVALIISSAGMMIFGCGTYRGQISQSSSRRWSVRVWNALGGTTLYHGFEQGKKRAINQCVSAIALVAGIIKAPLTEGT